MVLMRKHRRRGVPRVMLVTVLAAFLILVLQVHNIHSRMSSSSFSSSFKTYNSEQKSLPRSATSKLLRVGKFLLFSDSMNSTESLEIATNTRRGVLHNDKEETGIAIGDKLIDVDSIKDEGLKDDNDSTVDDTVWQYENAKNDFSVDLCNRTITNKVKYRVDGIAEPNCHIVSEKSNPIPNVSAPFALTFDISGRDKHQQPMPEDTINIFASCTLLSAQENMINNSSSWKDAAESLPNDRSLLTQQNGTISLDEVSLENKILQDKISDMSDANGGLLSCKQSRRKSMSKSSVINKYNKDREGIPTVSLSEMNNLLLRNRASYRSMKPLWYSSHDNQILEVKSQIENAPVMKNDRHLYAPVFRNISMFKRSYELMENTLKVYIYKEGEKPIFHQPLLNGIYASEGWFMKLLETSRHFVVEDPRRANMFYLPFSSRLLQFTLYVPNSHNRTNMEKRLKDYGDMIATKYPFWNRTDGADHFLVACHDWAPYQTIDIMGHTIRALCNADIRDEFHLGKDVSLLQANVLSSKNPLKGIGGRPPDQRPTLAFYAGNMHGTLRPILLHHWQNKDPELKIFGPMTSGAKSKIKYVLLMKSSKYCICPRGHEVNSPRLVEAIFYECVPVIISDNYVLPFFDILNWEAFSVIIPEVDIPRLKDILLSIPKEKYLSLQLGVRKVQQHFLWRNKPVKYDAFHMILHNIWYNRVFTVG